MSGKISTPGPTPLGQVETDRFVGNAEEKDYDDPELYPMTPGVSTTVREFRDRFVEYDVRSPNDGVRSGPVGSGWGPGRWFPSRARAYGAMQAEYGPGRVKQLSGWQSGRWAFLIKNLKTEPKLAQESEHGATT